MPDGRQELFLPVSHEIERECSYSHATDPDNNKLHFAEFTECFGWFVNFL